MNEMLSKTSSIIPELYFDIISRFTAGVVFILGCLYFVFIYSDMRPDKDWVIFISPVLVILIATLLSYVIGFLIDIVGIAYEALFRCGYNPATEYTISKPTADAKKKLFLLLEIALGFPFSILLMREYRLKRFETGFINDLNRLINIRFSKIEGFWKLIYCREYVRSINYNFGTILTKMKAEANMCRNLAITFFIMFICSIYYGALQEHIILWLCFSLATTAFSYRRRVVAENIYSHFYTIAKETKTEEVKIKS